MAADTINQIEMTIEAGSQQTQQTDEKQEVSTIDSSTPKCICSDSMVKKKPSEITDDDGTVYCNGCSFRFNKKQKDEYFYHCAKGKVMPHKRAYDLCLTCAAYRSKFNTDPINDIHNRNKLYFVYNRNKINGPYLMQQIITEYVTKKFKEKKLYIMAANGDNKWHKLTFPNYVYKNLKDDDEKRTNLMEECEKLNDEIKETFPILYKHLIENVLSGNLRQVEVPEQVPEEEKKASLFRWMIRILGKIFAISLSTFIILHCMPGFIVLIVLCCITCCYFCCTSCCCERKTNVFDDHPATLGVILYLGSYAGMIISPAVIVFVVLTQTDIWSEIQSWMISYITWGIMSFTVSTAYLVASYYQKGYDWINSVILLIIGVDFGDFDVMKEVSQGSDLNLALFGVLFVFPALASFLPAAIVGFIANFILEEKFELKCSADATNEYLCFEEKYGCCEIISSHDYHNSYEFIGGLASNILAIWAVIRIVGYLLVNGFKQLSLYAVKK
eukprot:549844_1